MAQLSPTAAGDPGDHMRSAPPSALSFRSLWLGWMTAAAVLLPVLLAIWAVPGFMTQDGPTHLYNAWILACSFSPQSPYHDFFVVQWQPLPNWAGHLALAGLLRVVSPWSADRIMMSLTLLGFAFSLAWLRWRVRGGPGIVGASILAAILSLNFPWLLGFSSFLLGCCLLPITLGVWWAGRDRLELPRMASLALLLILGYFSHFVSLGLTMAALGFLALFAPSQVETEEWWLSRLVRLGRTVLPGLPLLALAVVYLRLSRQGGPMKPVWENLSDPLSVLAWLARLGWVDPLTLARKDMLPFSEQEHRLFFVLAPVGWLAAAGLCLLAGGIGLCRPRSARSAGLAAHGEGTAHHECGKCRSTRRVWLGFGLLLLVAGWLGPDSLGSGHGEYLPQRVELLGLAALVPALDFTVATRRGRLAAACLLAAGLLQTLIVWDYALYSDRTAGQMMRAGDLVGRGQRIATVLIRIRNRFRSNPLLHADGWLGVGTGNILWSNYEARYYYFPVRFRPGIPHPDPRRFEDLARTTDPQPGETAIGLWEGILRQHHQSVDKVVAWHRDPAIDVITERWYKPVEERGDVRVFARSALPEPAPAAFRQGEAVPRD